MGVSLMRAREIRHEYHAALASLNAARESGADTKEPMARLRAAMTALEGASLPVPGKRSDTPGKPSGKPEPRMIRELGVEAHAAYGWRELHAFNVQVLSPRGRWVTAETLELPVKYPKRAHAYAERLGREHKARVRHAGRIGYVNIEGDRISRAQYKRLLKGTGHVETCPKHKVTLGAGRWCGKCKRRWTSRALYGPGASVDSTHVNAATASIMARKPYT